LVELEFNGVWLAAHVDGAVAAGVRCFFADGSSTTVPLGECPGRLRLQSAVPHVVAQKAAEQQQAAQKQAAQHQAAEQQAAQKQAVQQQPVEQQAMQQQAMQQHAAQQQAAAQPASQQAAPPVAPFQHQPPSQSVCMENVML
jgi:flagellar biosynthesis GTPase FlhF